MLHLSRKTQAKCGACRAIFGAQHVNRVEQCSLQGPEQAELGVTPPKTTVNGFAVRVTGTTRTPQSLFARICSTCKSGFCIYCGRESGVGTLLEGKSIPKTGNRLPSSCSVKAARSLERPFQGFHASPFRYHFGPEASGQFLLWISHLRPNDDPCF